ncbi:MAG: 50S ribosomal protein L10 [Flavobacteriales bacterium]|nr:50S ribosomal protein L10 [Flavobacteriales bacterium]
MTRAEKDQLIGSLTTELANSANLYITDISGMDMVGTSKLRKMCFDKNVTLSVTKNTLLKRAMENSETDYSELYDVLKGNTAIMFSESASEPAKLIEKFRKKKDRPYVKAAFIEETVYIGDENLKMLSNIKSKNEMIGEVIGILQSPAKNVISALQSGGQTLSGIVKTLGERQE